MQRQEMCGELRGGKGWMCWLSIILMLGIVGCKQSTPGGAGTAPVAGKVVVYCSVDQEYAEAIVAAFEAAYPEIDIQTRFDTETTKTTGLVQRLRTEATNPQADLFWSSECFLTIRLAEEDVLVPYVSPVLENWPTAFRDSQRRWYAFAGRARVIAYDPKRTTDPPSRWQDLADPQYKGRVALADPVFGTTRGHVATWFSLWGKAAAEEYLRALQANEIRVVASNSQTIRELIQGTVEFAITDTDDVWAMQRNGHELSVVYPTHDDANAPGVNAGTLLIPNTLAFVGGRPENPALAIFTEFLLSAETERLLYESDSHNIPIIFGDEIDVADAYAMPAPLVVDYEEVADEMTAAVAAAVKILSGN